MEKLKELLSSVFPLFPYINYDCMYTLMTIIIYMQHECIHSQRLAVVHFSISAKYKVLSALTHALILPWQKTCQANSESRCCYFLGVHNFTAIAALEREMGWSSRKSLAMLCLWNKLLDMPPERLTKQIFHVDHSKSHGWCSEIKHLFTKLIW